MRAYLYSHMSPEKNRVIRRPGLTWKLIYVLTSKKRRYNRIARMPESTHPFARIFGGQSIDKKLLEFVILLTRPGNSANNDGPDFLRFKFTIRIVS